MIRAGKLCGRATCVRADPGTTMPTTVDERPDDTITGTHEKHGIGPYLQRQVAAGFWQLARVTGEQPFPVKNQLQIELEDRIIGIELTTKPCGRRAPL